MSKIKVMVFAVVIGALLLAGGVRQIIIEPPVCHLVAEITPTPGPGAPPACGNSSCVSSQ